jgi:hypothetical protein
MLIIYKSIAFGSLFQKPVSVYTPLGDLNSKHTLKYNFEKKVKPDLYGMFQFPNYKHLISKIVYKLIESVIRKNILLN